MLFTLLVGAAADNENCAFERDTNYELPEYNYLELPSDDYLGLYAGVYEILLDSNDYSGTLYAGEETFSAEDLKSRQKNLEWLIKYNENLKHSCCESKDVDFTTEHVVNVYLGVYHLDAIRWALSNILSVDMTGLTDEETKTVLTGVIDSSKTDTKFENFCSAVPPCGSDPCCEGLLCNAGQLISRFQVLSSSQC